MSSAIAEKTEKIEREVKKFKVVEDPFDRGKTYKASKKELNARKEMFDLQQMYEDIFFDMNHPEGKTPKEMESYIGNKKEELEVVKKRWVKSIDKHSQLRAMRK